MHLNLGQHPLFEATLSLIVLSVKVFYSLVCASMASDLLSVTQGQLFATHRHHGR